MTTGPHVSVNYDSNVWKPLSELRPPAPGTFQSLTWELQDAARIQITVTTHSEQKAEEEFKKDLNLAQKFRGEPAEIVSEHRRSWGDGDWLVIKMHNANSKPPRTEIRQFVSRDNGYCTVSIVGDEVKIPQHRETIEQFLRSVQVK